MDECTVVIFKDVSLQASGITRCPSTAVIVHANNNTVALYVLSAFLSNVFCLSFVMLMYD